MPKVSIIIPVYNVEKYLNKCLDSVINQTFKDIEIICINDGSTDNSLKTLEQYAQKDSRIIIINQKNEGVSAARNKGIKSAKSEYIVFVDSDDWIENNLVELAYGKISECKADIVIYANNYVEKNKIYQDKYILDVLVHYENKNIPMEDIVTINHYIWDKIFRKQFLIDNNIIFPTNIKQNEDGIFNLLCLYHNAKYGCLPFVLYNYLHNHKNSAMDNALHIISNDIKTCKYFMNTEVYKNSTNQFKIIVIDKFLRNLLYNYQQKRYKLYRLIYNHQMAQFLKFLSETVNSDILNSTVYTNMLTIFSNKKYIIEHIFSVKNIIKNYIKRKNITFCFLKLSFTVNPDRKEIKRFKKHTVSKNTILLLEANICHGETIPGYAKMFTELGYNVDIVLTSRVYKENPLCRLEKQYYQNIFPLSSVNGIKKILQDAKIKDYEYVFLNSYQLYYYNPSRYSTTPFFKIFNNFVYPQNGFIALEHHLESININMNKEKRILQLGNIRSDVPFCNSHYFGKIDKIHEKNNITQFVIVGAIETYRKNYNFLVESLQKLVNNNINNFHINFIGTGKIFIPSEIHKYISCHGRLPFEEMFNYVEKADFILTMLDPNNENHIRYITEGTSGTFQLSYGFYKPILIHSKFAEKHFFNENNSIIYDKDFCQAITKCINMSNSEYKKYVENLSNTVKEIEDISIKNLKDVINFKR